MGHFVTEGGQRGLAWAINIWEVPMELKRLGQVSNDGDALLGQLLRVSVLVAHHDERLAVDGQLVVQLTVT